MTVVKDHTMDEYNLSDQFPIGMRVLAVDDDSTCLMILETLLRKCQYNVSTAKSAVAALELLKESKTKFDLVISDVHMPDMDGFKLLEVLGLEMNLPVIMLSVNDDPKMVMKGVTHGACDYLLKPVRIEELRNIWQHVIRKKRSNNASNQDKPNTDSCNERGTASTGNSDQNGKSSKKRKDQDDDEEHESSHDNEDPSSEKKRRIVWNPQLHRKFVAAVNQLGVDKAVPKKILDLMNEEQLTRENVASHLQKYRLYLKRISQQANMMAAIGTADTPYLRRGSLGGHMPTLSDPQHFCNNAFRSCTPGGMTSISNNSVGLNVHGLSPSETPQFGHVQNLNNSINDPLKFQSAMVRGNQNDIQGMPMSIGLDPLQHNAGAGVSPIPNLTPLVGAKATFPMPMACSPSQLLDISNNVLKTNPQDTQGCGVYENLTSVATPNSQFSLPLLDHGRCSDIWSSCMQSSGSESLRQATMPPTDNMSSANLQGGNLSAASSITSLSNQSHDSLTDMHSQGFIFTNNPGQISNNVPFQGWDHHSHVIGNSLISANGNVDPEGHTFNRNLDFSFCDPLQMKNGEAMRLSDETSLKLREGYIMNQHKSQNSCITNNNLGSLEDFVSAMMKQKQDKVKLLDRSLGDNNYSGGTSM